MPFQVNASRRHHIPRQRHRVRDADHARGGGERIYSDLAITTALTVRALLRLPLRQTEGLAGSILQPLGVQLAVPDYSTLSRRTKAACLPAMSASPGGAVQPLVDSTGVKLRGPGEWRNMGPSADAPGRSSLLDWMPPLGRIVAAIPGFPLKSHKL